MAFSCLRVFRSSDDDDDGADVSGADMPTSFVYGTETASSIGSYKIIIRMGYEVMKIRAHVHLLLLTASALLLSPASTFLHAPSLFPTSSSWSYTIIISIRTRRIRQKHDERSTKRRLYSSSSEQQQYNSIISQLAFYPTDESYSERLKNVLSEWDHVKRDGIGKFFSDEITSAEKIVKGNVATAEDKANRVILDVSEAGEGSGDYLLKEGFHNMADTGIKLANEIRAVQQVFNELNAAKIVEEAAEDVVSTGLLMEKDLAMVVQNVVSSLKEAEEDIQLAIVAIASKEGLTDVAKEELTEALDAKARNIEESIKVANFVAKTSKQIAVEDQKVMSELEKTGDRLSDAIDATTESLTQTLRGVEGGEAIDAVSKIVSQAAEIVREDLSAAENIADAVGQKVVVEADAIMSIMDDRASEAVEAVRAAKSTVQEFTPSDTSESLQTALTKNVEEIRANQDTAERLAEAIRNDAINDQEAFEVLESSSREVNSLINAVDGAVGKAAEAASGKDSDGGVVADAVEKVEERMDGVEKSMSNVMDAVEKCQDCKVKDMVVMEDEKKYEAAKDEVDIESKLAPVDKEHDAKESDRVEDDAVSKTDQKDEIDITADEKKHNVEVSSSTAEEAKPSENEVNGEEVDTLIHSDNHHAGGEGSHVSYEIITSAGGHADDIIDLEQEEIGEMVQKIAEPTVLASGDHDNYGLRDIIEIVHHHRSEAWVDTLSSIELLHNLEHNVVAKAPSIVTEVDHIISAEAAYDISTWGTEAMAGIIDVVSSLYAG